MTAAAELPVSTARPSPTVAYLTVAWWTGLGLVAVVGGARLDELWPEWRVGFVAAGIWGINLLLMRYAVGPPFRFGRVIVLSVFFGLMMTLVGTGSYWATTVRFPSYRVFIERAALFVASCTMLSILGSLVGARLGSAAHAGVRWVYRWDWNRLRIMTYALAAVCLFGTYMSVKKIGYVPILAGDPESDRVLFPALAGIWFRFAVFGTVVALLAGVQACARRGSWPLVAVAGVCLFCATLFGNRFFAAFPLGAIVLLWDQIRARVPVGTIAVAVLVIAPLLAYLGWWRQQDPSVLVLSPVALALYGTLGEFRDLGWTMDYYSVGHPLLHGSTMGGMIVPLLPGPAWSALGVDKAAVFAHSNAAILATNMGQFAAQRVGLFGELFMNFGWVGALVGAVCYGVVIGYLDRKLVTLNQNDAVRGIILAVIAVATIYAQVGQWNMWTATIVESCYPILAVALLAARREARPA